MILLTDVKQWLTKISVNFQLTKSAAENVVLNIFLEKKAGC